MTLSDFSLKRYRKLILPVSISVLLVWAADLCCKADMRSLQSGILKGISFLGAMFPPDWSAFQEMLAPAFQSIVIAFLATVFGTIISVIFAIAAAANLSPKSLRAFTRFLIAVERSVPEIIIMLFLVAIFGLGPFAGVVTLTIGCIGMLGKLLADAIEELDPTMIESIEAVGANKLQVIVFGVFPQLIPNLISYSVFRFEVNIRLSVIIGAVGAGGIGYELNYAFGLLEFHRAFTALIVILIMIFCTDRLSNALRKNTKVEGALV